MRSICPSMIAAIYSNSSLRSMPALIAERVCQMMEQALKSLVDALADAPDIRPSKAWTCFQTTIVVSLNSGMIPRWIFPRCDACMNSSKSRWRVRPMRLRLPSKATASPMPSWTMMPTVLPATLSILEFPRRIRVCHMCRAILRDSHGAACDPQGGCCLCSGLSRRSAGAPAADAG